MWGNFSEIHFFKILSFVFYKLLFHMTAFPKFSPQKFLGKLIPSALVRAPLSLLPCLPFHFRSPQEHVQEGQEKEQSRPTKNPLWQAEKGTFLHFCSYIMHSGLLFLIRTSQARCSCMMPRLPEFLRVWGLQDQLPGSFLCCELPEAEPYKHKTQSLKRRCFLKSLLVKIGHRAKHFSASPHLIITAAPTE